MYKPTVLELSFDQLDAMTTAFEWGAADQEEYVKFVRKGGEDIDPECAMNKADSCNQVALICLQLGNKSLHRIFTGLATSWYEVAEQLAKVRAQEEGETVEPGQ